MTNLKPNNPDLVTEALVDKLFANFEPFRGAALALQGTRKVAVRRAGEGWVVRASVDRGPDDKLLNPPPEFKRRVSSKAGIAGARRALKRCLLEATAHSVLRAKQAEVKQAVTEAKRRGVLSVGAVAILARETEKEWGTKSYLHMSFEQCEELLQHISYLRNRQEARG